MKSEVPFRGFRGKKTIKKARESSQAFFYSFSISFITLISSVSFLRSYVLTFSRSHVLTFSRSHVLTLLPQHRVQHLILINPCFQLFRNSRKSIQRLLNISIRVRSSWNHTQQDHPLRNNRIYNDRSENTVGLSHIMYELCSLKWGATKIYGSNNCICITNIKSSFLETVLQRFCNMP